MKNLVVTLIILLFGICAFAQGGTQSLHFDKIEWLQDLDLSNYEGVDGLFRDLMIASLSQIDKHQELIGLEQEVFMLAVNSSQPFGKQVNAVLQANQKATVQNKMAKLEKACILGKGGQLVRKVDIKNAFAKHPGYGFPAMTNRIDIYINRMESETEDE